MKTFDEIKNMYDENILPTYGRYPVAFVKGSGSKLWDTTGKEYIDFASGIGVNSVGHSHPKWIEAVCSQAEKLCHVSNYFYTEPCVLLAEKLNTYAEMKGAFFCNSGAEANEGAIKAARKYSFDKYGAGRNVIITLKNSFHGRLGATLKATGQEKFHKEHFAPLMDGFRYVEANNIAALEEEIKTGKICAFMFEVVQGEGGVIPLCSEYLQKAAQLCKENDIILIADEVQTGIGRTGKWFGFQNYSIKPDAVTFAKGIAAGLPLGGFMLGEKMYKTLGAGDHATSFGGNPICTAAALAVLEILESILPSIIEKGNYIREKVSAMNIPFIKESRGMGLMLGFKLEGIAHTEVVSKLLNAGLFTLVAGADVLRLLPPLTISTEDIDTGLNIMRECLG